MLTKMRRGQPEAGRSRGRIVLRILGLALFCALAIHLAFLFWRRPSVDIPGEWRGVEFARLLGGHSGGLPEQSSYLLHRVPGGWRLFSAFPDQGGESGERFLPEKIVGPWPADLDEVTEDVPFGLDRWCPIVVARTRNSRPNEVLLVKPRDLWVDLIGARPWAVGMGPDLYVGGVDADGDLRTIPLRLGYPLGAFRMGVNVTPLDWISSFGRESCCQIRVVRREGEIVYTWAEHWHGPYPPEDARTVRVPAAAVRADAWRDQLAEFRKKLESLETGPGGRRTVFLDVGDNVEAPAVLRALECGEGDPGIFFLPWSSRWFQVEPLEVHLPTADDWNAWSGSNFMEEEGGYPFFVGLHADGSIHRRRVEGSTGDLSKDLEEEAWRLGPDRLPYLLLSADRESPWATVADIFRVAQDRGARILVVLGQGDPHIGWHRSLEIPLGAGEPVSISPGAPDGRDPNGATVRLALSEGATWEDAVELILDLLRRGVAGFRF